VTDVSETILGSMMVAAKSANGSAASA
jgi:hypothetical protein